MVEIEGDGDNYNVSIGNHKYHIIQRINRCSIEGCCEDEEMLQYVVTVANILTNHDSGQIYRMLDGVGRTPIAEWSGGDIQFSRREKE